MTIEQVLLAVLSGALGIGIIWTRIEKVLIVLRDIVKVLNDLQTSLADRTLSSDEVAALKSDIKQIGIDVKNVITK